MTRHESNVEFENFPPVISQASNLQLSINSLRLLAVMVQEVNLQFENLIVKSLKMRDVQIEEFTLLELQHGAFAVRRLTPFGLIEFAISKCYNRLGLFDLFFWVPFF